MSLSRRAFLTGLGALPLTNPTAVVTPTSEFVVNDVHTGLNPTKVERIIRPTSVEEIRELIRELARRNKIISVSGSRHATGGQQFAQNSTLIDMRSFGRILDLNPTNGILEVEAGIEWPELVKGYMELQPKQQAWGIRQKQGGADRMTLGGALAANAHGHGLGMPPIVADVDWLDLITADSSLLRCDRKRNKELFSLAIGGYGLFGVITTVGLRLAPRRKLRKRVEQRTLAEALALVQKRAKNGASYGYFQYSIAEDSPEFLRTGVLTTFESAPQNAEITEPSADIDESALELLLEAVHRDRNAAYRKYAMLELEKDGHIEWSDTHQLSSYPSGYHQRIDERRKGSEPGADLIFEVYVPRDQVINFAEDARAQLLATSIPLVYGTVRFIEKDADSFLAWAKKAYACVIFTPHVESSDAGIDAAKRLCRHLEQSAIKRGGSFYLTYNHFAERSELDFAYPQFSDFLALKRKYDPSELFQSEWYRFYKKLYS